MNTLQQNMLEILLYNPYNWLQIILKIKAQNVILAINLQNMKHLCQKHATVKPILIHLCFQGHSGDM